MLLLMFFKMPLRDQTKCLMMNFYVNVKRVRTLNLNSLFLIARVPTSQVPSVRAEMFPDIIYIPAICVLRDCLLLVEI